MENMDIFRENVLSFMKNQHDFNAITVYTVNKLQKNVSKLSRKNKILGVILAVETGVLASKIIPFLKKNKKCVKNEVSEEVENL